MNAPTPRSVQAALAAAALTVASWAVAAHPGPVTRAYPAEDHEAIVLEGPDGPRRYEIGDWRAWARDGLDAAVEGPLAIGPVRIGVDDIRRFGVAVASPDGERVLFSATSYAMLTTLSLVGVLDTQDLSVEMLPEPRMGDLEAPVWSPDGRHVAYTLGSARSGGEDLRIDRVEDAVATLDLTRQEMHAAWLRHDLPADRSVGPDAYRPWFRELRWSGGRLRFTVDGPGAGRGEPVPKDAAADRPPPRRWSVGRDGSGLRPEGPATTTP